MTETLMLRGCRIGALALMIGALTLGHANSPQGEATVRCGNLVYAVNKTSVCFSDRFLRRLAVDTNVRPSPKFVTARLDDASVYGMPFCVISGEGGFEFTPRERSILRRYLAHGGFVLASAGCSDARWARSFRAEIARVLPERQLRALPPGHPVFSIIYPIARVDTHNSGRPSVLEGLEFGGRLALVFSPDGLNDTRNSENCCCCGGDELNRAEFINANILAYALLN